MNILEFTILVAAGSFVAGLLGSLTGLGGGVVLVPLLTLFFKVDIRYAIGASLVSVIATSSGAAAAYVKEGFSNIRIGMFLEIATTVGALVGAFLAAFISTKALAVIFGVMLALFGVPFQKAATPGRTQSSARSPRHSPSDEWRLPIRRGRNAPLQCAARAVGLQPDVRRGRAFRTARHRLGSGESSRHGPGHENPLQGLHHHQQLHDRRHRCSQRGRLSQPRLRRSRPRHAGDARAFWRVRCWAPAFWSKRRPKCYGSSSAS